MYPLNMTNAAAGGYAVANTEGEHRALSDAGYEPKLQAQDIDVVRAKLDAAGVKYDKRLGLDKLVALLPE